MCRSEIWLKIIEINFLISGIAKLWYWGPDHWNYSRWYCCCCLVTKLCLTLAIHALWASRQWCLWGFSGKNTGVVRHFLLHWITLVVHLLNVQKYWEASLITWVIWVKLRGQTQELEELEFHTGTHHLWY